MRRSSFTIVVLFFKSFLSACGCVAWLIGIIHVDFINMTIYFDALTFSRHGLH